MGRVLRNFAWLTASSVVSQAMGAAALIFASRQLGPTVFGVLAMAQAVANLGLTVADMGLGRLGTRMISTGDEGVGADLVALRTCMNLLCLAAIVAGCFVLRLPGPETDLVVLSAAAATGLAIAPDFVWAGRQELATYGRIQVLQQFLRGFGIVTGIALTGSVFSVPFSTLVAGAIGALLGWALLPLTSRVIHIQPRRWRRYLLMGLPIGVAAMMPDIYINSDSLMVRALLGFRALGEYAAAYRLLSILLTIGGLFVAALFPEICRIGREIRERDRVLQPALLFCLVGTVPVVGVALLLPGEVMQLAYGSAYAGGVVAARLLLLVPIVAIPNLILSSALVAASDNRYNLVTIGLGGVLNLGLDALLLPRLGIAGGAIATLAAEGLVLATLYLRVKPGLPFSTLAELGLAGVAAGIAALALRSLPLTASAGMGFAVYLVCLTRFGLTGQLVAAWRSAPRLVTAHG